MGFYNNRSSGKGIAGADAETAFAYLCSGNLYAAYICLESLSQESLAVVYNKAYCLFMAGGFEECYRLLERAGGLSGAFLSSGMDITMPDVLRKWEFDCGPHLMPSPMTAPDGLIASQIQLLKAEAAYRLGLYHEVKRISAALGGKYAHLNELVSIIGNDNEL